MIMIIIKIMMIIHNYYVYTCVYIHITIIITYREHSGELRHLCDDPVTPPGSSQL